MGDLLGTHPAIRSFVEPRPVFDLVTSLAIDPRQDESVWDRIFCEYDRLFALAQPWHFADKTHPLLWIAEKVAGRYDDGLWIAMLRDVEPTVASMLRHRGVRRWCEQWEQYPVPNRFLGITEANRRWYRDASLLERCVARWWAHRNEIVRLTPVLGHRMLTVTYSAESLLKWKNDLSDDDVALIHDTLTFLAETN
jgi:hypothetical protein